ncbi:hypothetical protein [Moraxella lacunata]|uniref:hypothetical protein n=1 Tax=Moraxella lacunata TaxID=477 RepID=UPI003EE1FD30
MSYKHCFKNWYNDFVLNFTSVLDLSRSNCGTSTILKTVIKSSISCHVKLRLRLRLLFYCFYHFIYQNIFI